MHKSSVPNNFRVQAYLNNMESEFLNMFNSYHKYISYRNKLLHELAISEKDKTKITELDEKFKRNIVRVFKRIKKEDFE